MKTRLALFVLALVSACAAPPERPDPVAARTHAAALAEAEARAAVAVVGTKVCRRLTAGIGNHEWVSGTVIEASPEWVTVQIDNPGRMSHMVDGVDVVRGAKLKGRAELWTPCR